MNYFFKVGEVFQEVFHTNASDDTVVLNYSLEDSTIVTLTLDFKQVYEITI